MFILVPKNEKIKSWKRKSLFVFLKREFGCVKNETNKFSLVLLPVNIS
jgi:hypothetical protein